MNLRALESWNPWGGEGPEEFHVDLLSYLLVLCNVLVFEFNEALKPPIPESWNPRCLPGALGRMGGLHGLFVLTVRQAVESNSGILGS